MIIIGSHVSFGKDQLLTSVKEAISYNSDTFMFYTGAPQNTIRKDIDLEKTKQAQKLMLENNIDINKVICHAPYIVNPASNDPVKQEFAISFLKEELRRCNLMGIKQMVLHPGSAVNETREEGLNNIVKALNAVLDNDYDIKILLETMAGKGNECGINLEEINYLLYNQGISNFVFDFTNISKVEDNIISKIQSKLVEIFLNCGKVVMCGMSELFRKKVGFTKDQLFYVSHDIEAFEYLRM